MDDDEDGDDDDQVKTPENDGTEAWKKELGSFITFGTGSGIPLDSR